MVIPSLPIRFGQHPCTDSVEVCCNDVLPSGDVTTVKPKVSKKKCGHRNDGGLGFKILGSEDKNAGFAEFPWMVSKKISKKKFSTIHNFYGKTKNSQYMKKKLR